MLSSVTLTGTAADDAFVASLNASGNTVNFYANGGSTPVATAAVSQLTAVVVNGGGGNDSLSVAAAGASFSVDASGTTALSLSVGSGSISLSGTQTLASVDVGTSGVLAEAGASSSLTLTGSLSVEGTFDHQGGSLVVPGITISSGGALYDLGGSVAAANGNLSLVNAGLFDAATSASLSGTTGTIANAGTFEVDNSGGGTTTLSASFVSDNGTVAVAAGTLALANPISTPSGDTLTLPGPGTIAMSSWNVSSGTVNQTGGTVTLGSSFGVGSGTALGVYNLSGGTVTAVNVTISGTLNQTGGTIAASYSTDVGSYGPGTLNVGGGLDYFGTYFFIGVGGNGTVNFTGGSCSANTLYDGFYGTGLVTIAGSAVVNPSNEYVGIGPVGQGTLNQTGGTSTTNLVVGFDDANGSYALSGGTLNGFYEAIGNNPSNRAGGSTDSFTQNGGLNSVWHAVTVGDGLNNNSSYNLFGGSFSAGSVTIGNQGGTGLFRSFSGTAQISGDLTVGGTGPGTLGAYGGTLSLGSNLYVGYDDQGNVSLCGGTSTVAGTVFVSGDGRDGDPAGSGFLGLYGGDFTAPSIFVGYSADGTFTQCGGTDTTASLVLDGPSGTVGHYSLNGGTANVTTTTAVLRPSISGAATAASSLSYTLNLSATSSVGYNAITAWQINWGDGSPATTLTGNPSTATHTFTDTGHSHSITATASGGGRSYAATPVTVSVVPPASLGGSPTANVGVNYTLPLLLGPGITNGTWVVDWGDSGDTEGASYLNQNNPSGNSPDETTSLAASTTSLSHTFLSTGSRIITATATTPQGTFTATKTITVALAPTVTAVVVDGGAAQRSTVTSVAVTFSEPVTIATAGNDPGLVLTQTATNDRYTAAVLPLSGYQVTPSGGGTTWTLTFPQSLSPADAGNSLPNGTYTLDVVAGGVTDAGGQAMEYDKYSHFFRLFGDFSGDGTVGADDAATFSAAQGTTSTQPGYLADADVNASGTVDAASVLAFGADSGVSFAPAAALAPVTTAVAMDPLHPVTLTLDGGDFGGNGDALTYLWLVTGPNGTVALPGGNLTRDPAETFIPSATGTWSASVTATDTDLGISTTSGPISFSVAAVPYSRGAASAIQTQYSGDSGFNGFEYKGDLLTGRWTSNGVVTNNYATDVSPFPVAFFFDGKSFYHETPSSSSFCASTETTTYYGPDFTATVQYSSPDESASANVNELDFTTTITDRSSSLAIVGVNMSVFSRMQLPGSSADTYFTTANGGGASSYVEPGDVVAEFGTGAAAGSVDFGMSPSTQGYLQFADRDSSQNSYNLVFATDANNVGALQNVYGQYGTPAPSIAAGASKTYSLYLRFGPSQQGLNLTADNEQAFRTAHPDTVDWQDRRSIMAIFPTGNTTTDNPRGFVPQDSDTIGTDLSAFASSFLNFASNELQAMEAQGSQGMITWGLEGAQFAGTEYYNTGPGFTFFIGDPTQITTFAPEMATTDGVVSDTSLLDAYFAKFSAAGFETGICIRPTRLEWVPQNPQDAGSQHTYLQENVTDAADLLISKIEFAKQQWGTTLFYIDSTESGISREAINGILAAVHAAVPDVLLIPEQPNDDSVLSHSVTAEYSEPTAGNLQPGVDAITSKYIQSVYPNAFSLIRADGKRSGGNPQISLAQTDIPALAEGTARGDTYFAQGVTPVIQSAADAIALQDQYVGSYVGPAGTTPYVSPEYDNDSYVLRRYAVPSQLAPAVYSDVVFRDGLAMDDLPVPASGPVAFDFAGTNDNLSVDFGTGSPVPTEGISFDGNGGRNGLTILGSGGDDDITVQPGNNGWNVITVSAAGSSVTSTIYYRNVSQLVIDPRGGTDNLHLGNGVAATIPANSLGGGILVRRFGSLGLEPGAVLTVASPGSHSDRTLLQFQGLNDEGTIDLGANDMDITGVPLELATTKLAQGFGPNRDWLGNGITSSVAAADPAHLLALGVLQNDQGGSPLFGDDSLGSLFDGVAPGADDILVKFTYFGDANLDGKVDGADYQAINNGSEHGLSSWGNGDFNYDGVVDGADYGLIQTAEQLQGTQL